MHPNYSHRLPGHVPATADHAHAANHLFDETNLTLRSPFMLNDLRQKKLQQRRYGALGWPPEGLA
jgi:hypothetical protein